MDFHKTKISDIQYPIKGATTITFDIPKEKHSLFKHISGQHLIFRFILNGKEYRRSYSLNNCPYNETPQVTVKRVKNGIISNHINDNLNIGDELEISIPTGNFYAKIDKDSYKSYYLFAAGSGITPILSILKSVLTKSLHSKVYLLYGNKNQDTILFKDELDELQDQYPKQLVVNYILSAPKIWTTWQQWKGKTGRINKKTIEEFIQVNPPIAQQTEYYICGPSDMNTAVKNSLLRLDVLKKDIHIEQFNSEKHSISDEGVDNAKLTTMLKGNSYTMEIPRGKSILQVLKNKKIEPPYSCESGICGTCKAKLTKGEVKMQNNMALEDADIQKGIILTCQAIPLTPEIEIDFT